MNTATGFPNARVYLAEGGLGGAYAFNLVTGTPIIPIGELTGAATARIVLNSGSAGGQPALWSVGGLNTSAQYDGTIEDTHGIIKVGTGTWTLSSANLTYTGPTTVSNGVLAFSASSVAPANSAYTISAPGRLDVSALGVLGAANSIQGNGTLQGGLTGTGTVRPGFAEAPGVLTVTGVATLNGTTLINLNRTNSPNCGRLAAASIVYGGTLTVTNRGNTLVGGETFQLFSGTRSGSFTATNLPALAPGLSWDTSSLNTSGSLSVVGQIIPPSISSVSVVGVTNVISGTGGMPGAAFQLLTSTNVSLPLASWTILGTGTFATDGSWAYTNSAATNALQFYTAVEVLP
jgi:autotransporter-associated beta strand protein